MSNNTPVRLTFNPREWNFHTMHSKVGSRSFITDFMGNLVEAYTLGNWNKQWTEIQSPKFRLEKNTPHIFSFWLNGGENDRYQEVCSLDIIFDGEGGGYDNRYLYKLNRNYIQYTMHYKGWYLYEIPFITQDNDTTRMQFSVMDAPCTIMGAREAEYYANLTPDEPRTDLPQRSNLIYPQGYPLDAKWSWKVFGKEAQQPTNQYPSNFDNLRDSLTDSLRDKMDDILEDILNDAMQYAEDTMREGLESSMAETIKDSIRQQSK